MKLMLCALVISTYYQNAVAVSSETGRGSWLHVAFGFEKRQPLRKGRAPQGIPRHTLEGRNRTVGKGGFQIKRWFSSFSQKREEKSLFQSRTTN